MRCVHGGPDVDLDPTAEAVDVGAQDPVVGVLARGRSEGARPRGLTGGSCVAGGREQACRAGLLAAGELGGALVRRGCSGVPAASLGTRCGRVEIRHDRRVWGVDGRRPVPGVPVGVVAGVDGFGKRSVRLAAFPARRRLVHRGSVRAMEAVVTAVRTGSRLATP
jgi:hypothetical protein